MEKGSEWVHGRPGSASWAERTEEAARFDAKSAAPLELTIAKEGKWEAVSQLQKAVRRGRADLAVEWAHALWNADRSYGLFRMAVIANEEVSLGDPALARAFLESKIKRAWFEERGGFSALAYFAAEFAKAPKDRTSCDFASLASGARLMKEFPKVDWMDSGGLGEVALNPEASDPSRLSALWLALGTNKVKNPALGAERPGSAEDFAKICAKMGASEDLLACAKLGLELGREPNPIALALVDQKIRERAGESKIVAELEVETRGRGAWLYAGMDKHTRDGQEALAAWLRSSKEAKALCAGVGDPRAKADFLGAAVFRLEGHETTPRVAHPFAKRVEDWHWKTTAKRGGIDPDELRVRLKAALPELDAKREAVLAKKEARPEAASPSAGGPGSFKGR